MGRQWSILGDVVQTVTRQTKEGYHGYWPMVSISLWLWSGPCSPQYSSLVEVTSLNQQRHDWDLDHTVTVPSPELLYWTSLHTPRWQCLEIEREWKRIYLNWENRHKSSMLNWGITMKYRFYRYFTLNVWFVCLLTVESIRIIFVVGATVDTTQYSQAGLVS